MIPLSKHHWNAFQRGRCVPIRQYLDWYAMYERGEVSAHNPFLLIRHMTAEAAERNRQWLIENYINNRDAHRPMILEGDATWIERR